MGIDPGSFLNSAIQMRQQQEKLAQRQREIAAQNAQAKAKAERRAAQVNAIAQRMGIPLAEAEFLADGGKLAGLAAGAYAPPDPTTKQRDYNAAMASIPPDQRIPYAEWLRLPSRTEVGEPGDYDALVEEETVEKAAEEGAGNRLALERWKTLKPMLEHGANNYLGFWNAGKDMVLNTADYFSVPIGESGEKWLSGSQDFRRSVNQQLNSYIKEISGATVPAEEVPRLLKGIPNLEDSPIAFKSKLQGTIDELNSFVERTPVAAPEAAPSTGEIVSDLATAVPSSVPRATSPRASSATQNLPFADIGININNLNTGSDFEKAYEALGESDLDYTVVEQMIEQLLRMEGLR